jgi:hypothetical protein
MPVAFSGDFHIFNPEGHDFVVSDPVLQERSDGKGFRVMVTDLTRDYSGFAVLSHYCMGMGLGNAVKERLPLSLHRGVPSSVRLANVRPELFRNKCDVLFRFDVNPDRAVNESNYDNNNITKKFCWEGGHDGRFVSLRVGRSYIPACNGCVVAIGPGDAASVEGGVVRVRLEIMVQNCGNTAIRSGRVDINYIHGGGAGSASSDLAEDIVIEPGQARLVFHTVALGRNVRTALRIVFNCGESGELNNNNQFGCILDLAGF